MGVGEEMKTSSDHRQVAVLCKMSREGLSEYVSIGVKVGRK